MGKVVLVEIVEVGKYFIKSKIVTISDKLWISDGISSTKYNDRNNWIYCGSLITSFILVLFFAYYVR